MFFFQIKREYKTDDHELRGTDYPCQPVTCALHCYSERAQEEILSEYNKKILCA